MVKKRYFISGVWDLLHVGHINALKRAREIAGDNTLVVAVVTDAGAYMYKHEFPAQTYEERRNAIEALGYADKVVFDGAQFDIQYIQSLGIDYVLSSDLWKQEMPEHLKHLIKHIPVTFIPRTPDISTTEIRRARSE
ncbi:MAG: adenylyltransferase/cytidyltransferase family protein [Candidatus Thorarchaeota archaeon]